MPAPTQPENGEVRIIDGHDKVYYDGYWIRYYIPPPESLSGKKQLIESLKRRLFHHTESGINTPGRNLDIARAAYERATDPRRKRVNAAMLAGALFNRATDIFTSVVDLELNGVTISPDNELMGQCGEFFQEALELGKSVKHHSGHEGIDELWGEPLKAFTMAIKDFYRSRYIKLSQTMRDIDRIVARMIEVFAKEPGYEPVTTHIVRFGEVAKIETETIRSDPAMFEVWPEFVSIGELLLEFEPNQAANSNTEIDRRQDARVLLTNGKHLIGYLAGVRTPMPKSTEEYLESCRLFIEERP